MSNRQTEQTIRERERDKDGQKERLSEATREMWKFGVHE